MFCSGIEPRVYETIAARNLSNQEVVSAMKRLPLCADVEPWEVPDRVSITGKTVREVAKIHAAYEKDVRNAEVVEFSSQGKRQLWREAS